MNPASYTPPPTRPRHFTNGEIPGITRQRRERIECGIARGMDAAAIALRIGCPLEDVAAVWQRLDALNTEQERDYSAEQGPNKRPCGTAAAYRRHLRNNERPDDECRVAWSRQRTAMRRLAAQRLAAQREGAA